MSVNLVVNYTQLEIQAALEPILSLISKSEKAQRNLKPETWQYRKLSDHLKALFIAAKLMIPQTGHEEKNGFCRNSLLIAIDSLNAMEEKSKAMQPRFKAGSSQGSLLHNRINALQIAKALLQEQLPRTTTDS